MPRWEYSASFNIGKSAWLVTYIFNGTLVTAVDIAARAVNSEGTGEDVAQGQEATAVVLADNLLLAGADLGGGAGHGEGSKAESSEDGLDEHVCGI